MKRESAYSDQIADALSWKRAKSFTKSFLMKHHIPTAGYREYTEKEALKKDIGIFGYPMVLKATDWLAGKGVILAENREEAENAIEEMMGDRIFGDAADKVIVEECLRGIEASMLCFVDGKTIVPMESAQDYKRIFDGDRGPNTGGMGSYSPSLIFTKELKQEINEKILQPRRFRGFLEDGLDFHGVLFIGLMIGEDGPKVIEFNNRFGDPETQSVLMRLESDLADIFDACIDGTLDQTEIRWSDRRSVCVVIASGGYPGSYEKGKRNLRSRAMWMRMSSSSMPEPPGKDGKNRHPAAAAFWVSQRRAPRTMRARAKAFANVEKITFEGSQFRRDIGKINR